MESLVGGVAFLDEVLVDLEYSKTWCQIVIDYTIKLSA